MTKRKGPKTEPLAEKPAFAPSAERGIRKGYIRYSFLIRKDQLEKIRTLAYWQRRKIKKVMEEALNSYLEGKTIKPLPPEVEE